VQVLAGRAQGCSGIGQRLARAAKQRAYTAMQPRRNALDPPLEPRVIPPDGIWQQSVQGEDDGQGDDPSEGDIADNCRPNTTRRLPTAMPKVTAPPIATERNCGGASIAGATVQKGWLASPDPKEIRKEANR
jgi:hypothetical protein